MRLFDDKSRKSRKPTFGYGDYISDAVFFLLCVAIATIGVYVLVPILQPDMWRLL